MLAQERRRELLLTRSRGLVGRFSRVFGNALLDISQFSPENRLQRRHSLTRAGICQMDGFIVYDWRVPVPGIPQELFSLALLDVPAFKAGPLDYTISLLLLRLRSLLLQSAMALARRFLRLFFTLNFRCSWVTVAEILNQEKVCRFVLCFFMLITVIIFLCALACLLDQVQICSSRLLLSFLFLDRLGLCHGL